MILLGESLDLARAESDVRNSSGSVIRSLEFRSARVANLPEQALEVLKAKNPKVEFIEDIRMQMVAPPAEKGGGKGKTPPAQPTQSVPWGIMATNAVQSHANNIKGAGYTACVIDSGIDKDHPDLMANIVGGRNFVVKRGRINANDWDDDNGHGSHVAGTIAAADNNIGVIGMAPEAGLYAVKALDRNGGGYFSDIIDGINACVTAGTHVINMSMAGTVSPASTQGQIMQQAVNAARASGLEIVVAAGNESQNISNVIPAGLDNLIAVSAVNINLNFASFTNFGLSLSDFAAPGVSVPSTWKNGEYNTISGTSMASPHVAGAVLLKLSGNKNQLEATDLGASVSFQGAGFIDAGP